MLVDALPRRKKAPTILYPVRVEPSVRDKAMHIASAKGTELASLTRGFWLTLIKEYEAEHGPIQLPEEPGE